MTWRVLQGDCREVLRTLPRESVQCCVTSPPYWGLRDYGVDGQLGLESTPADYVKHMVKVFRAVRRVLRPDGTLWLNLGDTYCSAPPGNERPDHTGGTLLETRGRQKEARSRGPRSPRWNGRGEPQRTDKNKASAANELVQPNRLAVPGLKPKDLAGIPWRVAFALQADGWWLRQEIIWHKPNPMPEAVKDRPTRSHEQVFLLTPSATYFYDHLAIMEPVTGGAHRRGRGTHPKSQDPRSRETKQNASFSAAVTELVEERNARSVWTMTTRPFAGAHFATFPPELPERCIRAGSRAGDLVLDPFAGAGTTGLVALRTGRSFVGIELSPTYAAMARDRIAADAPLLNVPTEAA